MTRIFIAWRTRNAGPFRLTVEQMTGEWSPSWVYLCASLAARGAIEAWGWTERVAVSFER